MPQQPQTLWTIRRLSRELGRSRKSLSKALRYTTPDGATNFGPAWFLPTALTAIAEHDEIHRYDGGRGDSFEAVRWTKR
jgi:hypothetical protein